MALYYHLIDFIEKIYVLTLFPLRANKICVSFCLKAHKKSLRQPAASAGIMLQAAQFKSDALSDSTMKETISGEIFFR